MSIGLHIFHVHPPPPPPPPPHFNKSGYGPEYMTVMINLMSFAVPSGPPTNIQAIPLTSFSIKITWDPPHPSERNGQIIGYNIEVSKSGNSDDRDVYNISGTEFSLRVEGI